MLPGVVLPRLEVPELKGVEKGQLCSINLVGNRYCNSVYIYVHVFISVIHGGGGGWDVHPPPPILVIKSQTENLH